MSGPRQRKNELGDELAANKGRDTTGRRAASVPLHRMVLFEPRYFRLDPTQLPGYDDKRGVPDNFE